MHQKRLIVTLAALLGSIALVSAAMAVGNDGGAPQYASTSEPLTTLGTSFTYQGKLTDGGAPANGNYDIRFIMYDAESGGSQVGNTIQKTNVPVTNGLFTVDLDFGTTLVVPTPSPAASPSPSVSPTVTAVPTAYVASVFDGNARWLEIAVRPGGSGNAPTVLSPRQPVSPVPYAFYAKAAGGFVAPLSAAGASSGANGALDITQTGTGIGIAGRRTTGDSSAFPAIYGLNTGGGAGVQGESTFTNGFGVQGIGNGTAGVGGRFQGPVAVELDGPVRVTGSNKTAFEVTVGTITTCGTDSAVLLDNPLINGDSAAMLFVTAQDSSPATLDTLPAIAVAYTPTSCGAPATNKWVAYNAGAPATAIPGGVKLNILVIKQ
jgi:hypothetical protein